MSAALNTLRRRRARYWLDVRERRQAHRSRDDLRPGFLRHRHQREKLVVRRRPNHVVRAGQIFRTRHAAEAAKARAGKPSQRLVLNARAVKPHRSLIHGVAGVIRTHGRGGANDPFLRGQRERLGRGVFQPHARIHKVIRTEMEFLREPQAVRQGFFRANAIGVWVKVKLPSPTRLASPKIASTGIGARRFSVATPSFATFFFQRGETVSG